MAAIKKIFKKWKLDKNFKKAGEGHKLTDERQAPSSPRGQNLSQGASNSYQHQQQSQRSRLESDEKRRAAEAAMARMAKGQDQRDPAALAKSRMRRELEAERKKAELEAQRAEAVESGPREVEVDSAPVLSTVLYKCPDIGPVVLPKNEMEAYIKEFLLTQLAEEPEMTSALMIQTCNKSPERVKVCVDTLCKYIDNIIAHPLEEKFHKIRLENKVFKERVSSLEGTEEFLQACGFQQKLMPTDSGEEYFFVMDPELAKDGDRFVSIKEVLLAAEPIKPQLDRALKVFYPSNSASRFDIPDEFYNISPEELKKEQARRQEAVDKLGMLRTKAMRERDEQRELRKYRYTLIRIRLPDANILQGTFRASEKLSALLEFVKENLVNDWIPFQLITSTGQRLTEENLMLVELGLAPAAIVNFEWDKGIMAEVTAQQGAMNSNSVLKPELMELIRNL